MPFKSLEQKRDYNRERMRRIRAQRLAERAAAHDRWYREQAENPAASEQERNWARYMLAMPTLLDIAKDLAPLDMRMFAPLELPPRPGPKRRR